jgi:hypothetical protein
MRNDPLFHPLPLGGCNTCGSGLAREEASTTLHNHTP